MKKLFAIILGAGMLTSVGCKKSLLDVENPGAYSYETYFTDAPQINEAVIATYAVFLHNGMWSREYYFIMDLMGNDAKRDAPLQGDIRPLSDFTFTPANSILTNLWSGLYRMVLRSNVVIDRANAWNPTTDANKALKKQYIAEAKFMRGYANMQLVTLWGRVPLRSSYIESITNLYPKRNSVEELWAAVEADLKDAVTDLPLPKDQASSDLGRANKGSAIALLGRAYLYQKKYQDANTTLLALTKAPYTYSLSTKFDDLFSQTNQNNPEIVFQVMHATWTDWGIGNQYYVFGGQETWGGKATHSDRAQEYGFNDWRNVFVSDALVQAYKYKNEKNEDYIDPRAKSTFYGDAASGGKTDYCNHCAEGTIPFPFTESEGGYRWRKYQYYEDVKSYGGPQSGINSLVIRYADVLLMIAETYIQQNDPNSAQPYINDVRKRAGAFEYTTLGGKDNAMQLLMRERRLELAGEQSRYFDLLRWGLLKTVLNAELKDQYEAETFQDKNVLLPIPQQEKDTNPNVSGDVANSWN
ncbi:RagB/SusD family nutrient uptake outer membrane protein [Chitinophaga silvatica]|uniref:RagB/SusD family nutrient uptake outer membrane protein n=1 Tax=Chitinophaga silvatica TaxID=2282649 RepID=A0A3E1Y3K7_9BACT|nr:RagB/SusD family nutrient uptake outer membrane protein [Chitinophaga silvatica]RFS19285.1 RagB/SusD family nutrient uptake outer membrane protein [Chitinophaga silvatica]